jgi:hypothetical protein
VVLAGDHKLMGLWEVTLVARSMGLALSLMERMAALPLYHIPPAASKGTGLGGGRLAEPSAHQGGGGGGGAGGGGGGGGGGGAGGGGGHHRVLVRNYRNHAVIVSLAAKLFYGGDPRVLLPRAPEPGTYADGC